MRGEGITGSQRNVHYSIYTPQANRLCECTNQDLNMRQQTTDPKLAGTFQ